MTTEQLKWDLLKDFIGKDFLQSWNLNDLALYLPVQTTPHRANTATFPVNISGKYLQKDAQNAQKQCNDIQHLTVLTYAFIPFKYLITPFSTVTGAANYEKTTINNGGSQVSFSALTPASAICLDIPKDTGAGVPA